jgi:hypothetical protein
MPDEHSVLSASAASGWLTCYARPIMEHGRKTSSQYADEGTAAHTLAERVLSARVVRGPKARVTAADFVGEVIEVEKDGGPKRKFTVSSEFAAFVDDYVDGFMIRSNYSGAMRFVEQKLNYHEFLAVDEGLAFGTGDGVAVIPEAPEIRDPDTDALLFPAGTELQVHDLKFGMGVRVEAKGNEQLRLYGLGALQDFSVLADIDRVRMVIHQPRLDHTVEEVISVTDLLSWSTTAKGAAQVVVTLWKKFGAPSGRTKGYERHEDVPAELAKHQHPSEKACKFCDGKAVCAALRAEVHGALSGGEKPTGFDNLEVEPPEAVKGWGDNWLAMFASKLELIELLTKAARAEIDRRVLLQGKTVEGFKVVAGKKGSRAFAEPGEVEAYVAKRVPRELRGLFYKASLLTPTQLEKALKEQPAIWAQLQPFITQAEGKPAVVPVSDPRKPIEHRATSDSFANLDAATEGATAASSEQHPFRR